jgi:hypothetical protein
VAVWRCRDAAGEQRLRAHRQRPRVAEAPGLRSAGTKHAQALRLPLPRLVGEAGHLAGQLADQLYLHLVAQGWVGVVRGAM